MVSAALESGALNNVKAIVIGRFKGGDLTALESELKSFIKKSGIAVFTIEINGRHSLENLELYHQTHSFGEKVGTRATSAAASSEAADIVKPKSLELLSGSAQDLSDSDFISTNYRNMRFSNGTPGQIDAREKTLILSANMTYVCLHLILVESSLSGSLDGVKAAILL